MWEAVGSPRRRRRLTRTAAVLTGWPPLRSVSIIPDLDLPCATPPALHHPFHRDAHGGTARSGGRPRSRCFAGDWQGQRQGLQQVQQAATDWPLSLSGRTSPGTNLYLGWLCAACLPRLHPTCPAAGGVNAGQAALAGGTCRAGSWERLRSAPGTVLAAAATARPLEGHWVHLAAQGCTHWPRTHWPRAEWMDGPRCASNATRCTSPPAPAASTHTVPPTQLTLLGSRHRVAWWPLLLPVANPVACCLRPDGSGGDASRGRAAPRDAHDGQGAAGAAAGGGQPRRHRRPSTDAVRRVAGGGARGGGAAAAATGEGQVGGGGGGPSAAVTCTWMMADGWWGPCCHLSPTPCPTGTQRCAARLQIHTKVHPMWQQPASSAQADSRHHRYCTALPCLITCVFSLTNILPTPDRPPNPNHVLCCAGPCRRLLPAAGRAKQRSTRGRGSSSSSSRRRGGRSQQRR